MPYDDKVWVVRVTSVLKDVEEPECFGYINQDVVSAADLAKELVQQALEEMNTRIVEIKHRPGLRSWKLQDQEEMRIIFLINMDWWIPDPVDGEGEG